MQKAIDYKPIGAYGFDADLITQNLRRALIRDTNQMLESLRSEPRSKKSKAEEEQSARTIPDRAKRSD